VNSIKELLMGYGILIFNDSHYLIQAGPKIKYVVKLSFMFHSLNYPTEVFYPLC
jgi:hypothetical protein